MFLLYDTPGNAWLGHFQAVVRKDGTYTNQDNLTYSGNAVGGLHEILKN